MVKEKASLTDRISAISGIVYQLLEKVKDIY